MCTRNPALRAYLFTGGLLALVAPAADPACGQSLNIDIGTAVGTPSDNYAAVGLSGVWNDLPDWDLPCGYPLVGLDGSPTGVCLVTEGSLFPPQSPDPAPRDYARLLEDGGFASDLGMHWVIWPLEPGPYRVITYAYNPWLNGWTTIEVASAVAPTQTTTGSLPEGIEFLEGVTHTIHVIPECDGNIGVWLPDNPYMSGAIQGVQIVSMDCNNNGVLDDADLAGGTSQDCNDNGYPDECETQADCNNNGTQDICELAAGSSEDCNGNSNLDECDIACEMSDDCNGNDIPDECDLATGASEDCNGNAVPDACDVAVGTSPDCDKSGVPDECESTWHEETKFSGSDASEQDRFGSRIAIDGDTMVVTAYGDDDGGALSGSVYVFTWDGNAWVEQAKLIASGDSSTHCFGDVADISGDTIIVGDSCNDDAGVDAGAVHIFRWDGNGWAEEAKLTASDTVDADYFGCAVRISADIIVVGAYGDDDGGGWSGSAYVFQRVDDDWIQRAKLIASDAAAWDEFGREVAISGDTVVVGAPKDDDGGSESGSAYVFIRDGAAWTQQAKLTASDAAENDLFGRTIAIDGEIIVVGTDYDDHAGWLSGSAYVYQRDGVDWEEQAKLIASDAVAYQQFGSSVAIDATTIVVGAPHDFGAVQGSGSAYVFEWNGSDWIEQDFKLGAHDAAEYDHFGVALAVRGDTIVVGTTDDDDFGYNSGAAYVFRYPPEDCNRNGTPDLCDLADGTSSDCNDNLIPDECESTEDCNDNNAADICDLATGASMDCNANGTLDECDIAGGTAEDCNENGMIDLCEVALHVGQDCNENLIPDDCDVAAGTSADRNGDDIPDECPMPKNRYISFLHGESTELRAYHVTLAASLEFPGAVGSTWWIDAPDDNGVARLVSSPVFRDWSGDSAFIHAGDCEVAPTSTYEIRSTLDGETFAEPLVVATIGKPWRGYYGDVVGWGTGKLPPLAGFTPANGIVNASDIQAFLLTVQGPSSPSAHPTWMDLHGDGAGCPPNFILNVSDLQRIKFGFQGQRFADSPDHMNPADCP